MQLYLTPEVGQRRTLRNANGAITPIVIANVTPANQGGDCYHVTDTNGHQWLFAQPSQHQLELKAAA